MIPYTIVQCKVLRKKYNKTKIRANCVKHLLFLQNLFLTHKKRAENFMEHIKFSALFVGNELKSVGA